MGKPFIDNTKIDKDTVHKLFSRVKFQGDAMSFEDWLMMFIDRINEAEEDRQEALDKVKKYEAEINADSRVQEIKAKYDDATKALFRGFGISVEESKAILEWKDKHDIEQHGLITNAMKLKAGGVSGGRYHYEFYPTAIGTSGECVCGACHRKAFIESGGDLQKFRELLKKYDAKFEFQEIG